MHDINIFTAIICNTVYFSKQNNAKNATILINPVKHCGVRWLYFEVFSAIQV